MSVIEPPAEFNLYTAQSRLDLWDALKDSNHPLSKVWPRFIDHDLSQEHFSDKMLNYSGLRKFQFVIVERDLTGREIIIACARSIPFFWPQLKDVSETGKLEAYPHVLQSLPDGGWDTILARGIRQHLAREGLPSSSFPVLTRDQEDDLTTCGMINSPNALSAICIAIREDRRQLGFAERLIEAMRRTAQDEHFRALVVPLRPTRKSEFLSIPMEDYISWAQTDSLSLDLPNPHSHRRINSLHNLVHGYNFSHELPFDPWLRKHVRLGGTIAKIAPSSMFIQGTVAEWQDWTGIDFGRFFQKMQAEDLKIESVSNRKYLEVSVPGGLVPLRVYVREQTCTYIEPNVWLYHKI